MEIDELPKPGGTWCTHRRTGKGCSIYGQHPPSCQAFACQWLLEPSLPHRFRPDQSHVVLVADGEQRLIAHCDPANPLAWRREPMYSLLKEQAAATWASEFTVAAKAGQRIWFITPTTDIDLGIVDPRSPTHFVKAPDGSVEVEVLPPIEPGQDVEEQVQKLRISRLGLQRSGGDG